MRLRDLFEAFNILDAPFAVWDRLPQWLREWIKWTFAAMLLTANAWLAVITSAIDQWDPYATFFIILAGTVLSIHLLFLLAKANAWRKDRKNIAQYGYKNSIDSVVSLHKKIDEISRSVLTLSARIDIISKPYDMKLAELQLPKLQELRDQAKSYRERRVWAAENAESDHMAAEAFHEHKGERLSDSWDDRFEQAGLRWDFKEQFKKIEDDTRADRTATRVTASDIFKNSDEKASYLIIERKYLCMENFLDREIARLQRLLKPNYRDWLP